MSIPADKLQALLTGPVYFFRDWPNRLVPHIAAGVYTIWRDDHFIYVGMAGRGLTADTITNHRATAARRYGLYTRLNSHASGRRSGDQFCVYVADRLVLPELAPEAIKAVADGRESMDRLVRAYIRTNLSYRFAESPDSATALAWEDELCRRGHGGALPNLNPR